MNDDTCEVLRAGPLTTLQDLGRTGLGHLAVPRAGAVDRPAHVRANRLVGNPPDAATLETTLHGVALRFASSRWVAVTGAPAAVRLDNRPAAWGTPLHVPAGSVVDIGTAHSGLRSYLAVAGGFAAETILGSRSRDVLAGVGPDPLRDGSIVPLGSPLGPPAALDFAPWPLPPVDPVLDLTLGPRHDWFERSAVDRLLGERWMVTPEANRIGIRLSGPSLERSRFGELPSEGTVVGAVEVPGDGQPLIFLNDHPTTVGYPVIAVVSASSLPVCAQLRPGQTVRFKKADGRKAGLRPSADPGGLPSVYG